MITVTCIRQVQKHPSPTSLGRRTPPAPYDRVNIAKLGHAKAPTNFPAAEFRAEWAQLEALGVEGAVAQERRRAQQLFTAM